MNSLALDLGKKTGWAMSKYGVLTFGTYEFKATKKSHEGDQYLIWRIWLEAVLVDNCIHTVYYEDVKAHKGSAAAHCYGYYLKTVLACCALHKIGVMGVGVKSIKKYWTDNGNATKEMMIASAIKRGYNVSDDNQADAVALLQMCVHGNRFTS